MFNRKRPAARVVLFDRDQRIFLMQASDPLDPYAPAWWEIPGGGMGHGEDSADAARRELFEETGFFEVEMGPCVWTQQVQFTFAGMFFDSDERIHVAWCDGGEWNPTGLEAFEIAAFEAARWWKVDDVLAATDRFLPPRLKEFLPDLARGVIPSVPQDISPP